MSTNEEGLESYAKRRMKEMNQAADEVVDGLGLPPEARHDALRVMFGGKSPQAEEAEEPLSAINLDDVES